MLTALIFSAVVFRPAMQDAQNTQNYTDPQLGLSFAHSSAWILEKPNVPKGTKKNRRKNQDDSVHFRIPLTGAVEDADLVIMRAGFSGPPETWQKIQTDTNTNLHREVERQWQQDILGVPLLLTRINYAENGVNRTTLTGLLYNDAPSKLLFRLTGPASDFDKAQFQFDQAMQTLRTTNNELPKAQDPNAPPSQKTAKTDDRGAKHVLYTAPAPAPPKLAPVVIPLVVSTKKVELRVPKGWTADHVDGNTLELHTPELPYPLKVKLASTLDSDPPATALLTASADSLKDFTSVVRRDDTKPVVNEGGCAVASIWRTGKGANGELVSMEAAGTCGDFYFVATCRPVPGPSFAAQRKALEQLLQGISIQAVP